MRPQSLDEVVGQAHLLRPGSPLRVLASSGGGAAGPVSVILWGPPGTGKTTLAQAIAQSSGRRFVELSAVTAGIKDVRTVMERALNDRDLYDVATVLFLDEIHRFTKAQQDALLPGVENGWVTLVAATTENPSFSVISPLLSRSLLLTLEPLTDQDLSVLIQRAVADPRGLNGAVELTDEALEALVQLSSGDARRALTALEAAAGSALSTPTGGAVEDGVDGEFEFDAINEDEEGDDDGDEDAETDGSGDSPDRRAEEPPGPALITGEIVAVSVDRALLRYDRNGDQHYDVISAFIKSLRGSDPDAAIHYLARMIEAGEDPRFIARRLMVHAAEDVGMADPQALPIAVAAAEATQLIGLPEARIPLAEATIYIATAPKSNAVISAIDSAIADVKAGRFGLVPKPLRDAHYPGAKRLGHGKGYLYPHSDPRGVVRQQYLPDELEDTTYYRPTQHGREREIADRLEKIRRITRGG
ncbi:AAA family ATPase [Leucobacter sp. OLJS4]|uniref:replication-associated recombination protein A n=1 Tax=unclassified Leucobacter TaxID=2621730 RepID=UPI000C17AD81|nr:MULTISPECIES: replication-associated recombination protein A [unclassified Leucobacter]PIJ53580.1 AAA family ATPase [Leucobacter sp. OLES1]PII81856.1 AAA family ATPase [Leucobacter sp. OLCALW19]PII86528.1 AAA family ATPase [Leucobacter sp. OLTLW20]PII90465.1 AAA family ATPase [Leucobacter sp. OLAS13]PII97496.1 AAA family ATPase [Leucobacter sp. OLDS2]